jgi:uncharacterized membrane protein
MSGDAAAAQPGQLSLRRLERVSDIVHVVALLALLVSIRFIPAGATNEEATSLVLDQMEPWIGFVVGFLIIGYYWISHQEYFSYYIGTDKGHTWLELLYLVGIATMPLGNQAMAVLPTSYVAMVVVSLEIAFVGVMQYFAWMYATKNNRLVPPGSLDPTRRSEMGRAALLMPVAAVLGAIAGYFYAPLWYVVLIVGPVALSARKKSST